MNILSPMFALRSVLFLTVFSCCFPAFSSTIIHIDTQGQDVRVVAFDSKRQKLLKYETLPKAPFNKTFASFLPAAGAAPVDREMNYSIMMDAQFSLTLIPGPAEPHAVPSRDSYILMTTCPLQTVPVPGVIANNAPAFDRWLGKIFWSSVPIVEKTPEELRTQITGLSTKHGNDPEFMLVRHDDANMRFLSSLSTGGKGSFGELITRMTMFSYGYSPRASIYGGNQGLDGIFVSFSNTYLLLAQSKVGNANPMALTVIKNELHEPHIYDRLELMAKLGCAEVRASRVLVYDFIRDQPQNVYKMAQCLFNCGLADFRIQKFDVEKMPRQGVQLYGAPVDKKVAAVRTTLEAFEEEPLAQLDLALASMNLNGSPQKQVLRRMFNRLGVDAATQETMLAHLDDEEAE